MKHNENRTWLKNSLGALAVGALVMVNSPANAANEMIWAVDTANNIFSFYSATPGTIEEAHPISGLQTSEEIRGIDYWNGQFYGLGSFSHLYTINPNTGIAMMMSPQFVPLLNGVAFGVDNGATDFRVVSDLRQNLSIDRVTGAATASPNLTYAAGDPLFGILPNITALAYNSAGSTWLAADSVQNTFSSLNPVTGTLTTIGPSGIDFSRYNGLDISSESGSAYFASPASSSGPQANLYTVNQLNGAVTLVGLIGNPGDDILVRGLTVVPEPSSVALLAMGGLGLFYCMARRRK